MINNTKMLIHSVLIGLFVYLVIGLFPPFANGATMSNDDYTIDKRSVKIQPFTPEVLKKREELPYKPLASGKNFTVETTKPNPFIFNVSQNMVEFGKLTATNPVLRELTLKIKSTTSYQLFAGQDHPLRTDKNLIIPDTTCDNGSCSEISPAPWKNTLTYGFGYYLGGPNEELYKQFADSSRHESGQNILSSLNANAEEYKLTAKINISGMQNPGAYSNTILLIATPDF